MAVHSSYLREVFIKQTFKIAVERVIKDLTPHLAEFDSIAFRGNSGALMAAPVAYALDKGLLMVRKDQSEEPSHHTFPEGADCAHYLILDDFMSSGNTIKTIVKKLEEKKILGKPVAIYLWSTSYGGNHRKEYSIPGSETLIPIWSYKAQP